MFITSEEIKSRLTIFDIAGHLGIQLIGKNGIYHSPFRADRNPSFSISKDGKLFNDFSTNDKGDIFNFYTLATGANFAEAKRICAELAGIKPRRDSEPIRIYHQHAESPHSASYSQEKPLPKIPRLDWSDRKARQLEVLRGYSIEAQRITFERGVFGFAEYKGLSAWIITDGAGKTAQARRLDGLKWADHNGGHKTETLHNSNCAIPAGLNVIDSFPFIAICEGSADFLAVFHLAYVNDCENDIAPLAIFGARQRLAQEVLKALEGKRIIIFPDADKAGQDALKRWGEQLTPYAEKVFYFDFNGFHRADGETIKDLSDFIALDVDEWETRRPLVNPFYTILTERN